MTNLRKTYRRTPFDADPARLSFDRATLALVGSASDLGINHGPYPECIAVTSPRTGLVATYLSASVVRLPGDVSAFHYNPQNRVAAQATPGGLLIT